MLSLHPRRSAACLEQLQEILFRIDPHQLPARSRVTRVPLNLALVLDRSGSMAGEKIDLTIQAACQAVTGLTEEDFLTVVVFDEVVDTIFTGQAEDRATICALIREVRARNQTDLYAGWLRGAEELGKVRHPSRLSRVVLLTDGQANRGLTSTEEICSGVSFWAQRGVQTTTLGFGTGYAEELLRPMAAQGCGNHAYIEDASRLSAFFEEEMSNLARTRGTQVRLRLSQPVQWLTEPTIDSEGRVCLADLVEGQSLAGVFRLQNSELQAEVSWHDLESSATQKAWAELKLPVLDVAEWRALPTDPEVDANVARAMAELRRRSAMALLRWHQEDAALQCLGWALALPALPDDERAALHDLIATVERGDYSASYKKAAMYGHGHGHGHRISAHYAQESGLRQDRRSRSELPLGDGPILHAEFKAPYSPDRRIMGMLRGHFFGERLVRGNRGPLGEGGQLSRVTFHHLITRFFDPAVLAEEFAEAPVLHPTTSQQKFRRRFNEGGSSLLEVGSVSAGCAALRRICPFVMTGRPTLYFEVVLATLITHRDNLALSAAVGYAALLWKLLFEPCRPPATFYAQTFLEAIAGLEYGPGYECRAPGFKDWRGHLKDFLPLALGRAREEGWSVSRAIRQWGSGPYLLEVVPTLLYILEQHADDPDRALKAAISDTMERDTLGMLVGAALGALYGEQPGWFLHDEVEDLLDRLKASTAQT